MKLELKHICGYLPYGLKYQVFKKDRTEHSGMGKVDLLVGITQDKKHSGFYVFWGDWWPGMTSFYYQCKPILRPLSDLTKEITHKGETFVPIDILGDLIDEKRMGYNDHYINYEDLSKTGIINWLNEPYFIVDQLIEWHFDVFSLIDNRLAVDVNTLEDNPYE